MQHFVSFCAVVLAALSQATAIAQAPDYEAEIEDAIGAAKRAASFEHLGLLNRLCVLPPSVGPRTSDTVPGYVTDPSTAPPRDRWYADATQVFDDLYWLGGSIHSAWLLTTAAGHILIDTEFPYNSEVLILEGMRKFGFDPGIPNLERYIASQAMFAHRAAEAGATVLLSNHSEFDNAQNKSRMIAGRGFGPNPFVSSTDSVQRYFDVMTNCARARIIDLERQR